MAVQELTNDREYFDWLDHHREGFVLNVRASHRDDYAVLHTSDCKAVTRRNVADGAYTERGYRKAVGDSVAELRTWLGNVGRSDFSAICRCVSN